VAVRIEAFDPGLHDTKDFRCDSNSQDNVLRRTAKRQQRDGYTRLSSPLIPPRSLNLGPV